MRKYDKVQDKVTKEWVDPQYCVSYSASGYGRLSGCWNTTHFATLADAKAYYEKELERYRKVSDWAETSYVPNDILIEGIVFKPKSKRSVRSNAFTLTSLAHIVNRPEYREGR
jgi:hypothetical protein